MATVSRGFDRASDPRDRSAPFAAHAYTPAPPQISASMGVLTPSRQPLEDWRFEYVGGADPTRSASSSSFDRQSAEDGRRNGLHQALAAAVPAKKARKTNSERGREFRERRKRQEADLVAIVSSLRREVVDLDFLHGLRREVLLRRRHALEGSLVRTALQYFDLFSAGAAQLALVPGSKRAGSAVARADRQEAFLRYAMDPEMQFGELTGWLPLLEQWRRYTAFHAGLAVSVTSVEVVGPEESPVVTVRSDLSVIFSRDTFANVFPHAAHDEELVRKFCGRRVTYKGVNQLQFSSDGRVVNYDADVGFVDALMASGASISDLALLMNEARIVDQCQLGDDPGRVVLLLQQDGDDNQLGVEDESAGDDQEDEQDEQDEQDEPKRSRFDVDFLLS